MRALPPWITPAQHRVLAWLVTRLDALGIPYVASGGLAGNLHGSDWPLHDIDLDVPASRMADVTAAIAASFPGAVLEGPRPYADEEFALELLTARVDGVDVDVSAAESVVLRAPDGTRHAWPTALDAHETRTVGGLAVRVVPLASLLAYKRVIGRAADVAALEALEALARQG